MPCYSCMQKAGEVHLSPGEPIYSSKNWRIEHAYPSKIKGWLVVVLQRHAEALHELSTEEFDELNEIVKNLIPIVRELTGCQKEYVACFAEKEGFHHIHFHVIPRDKDLPTEAVGSHVFSMLRVDKEEAVPPQEVISFCNKVRDTLSL